MADSTGSGDRVSLDWLNEGYSVDRLPELKHHLEHRQDQYGSLRSSLLRSMEGRGISGKVQTKLSPEMALFRVLYQIESFLEHEAHPRAYLEELREILKADEPEDPEHPSPRVTDELVAAFSEAYAVPGYEEPDPERVRRALNRALKTAGASVIVAEGFIASGDSNQSDGMGPSYEIGRYSTLEEAQRAARGKGVQGDSGTVDSFETVLASDGTVKTLRKRLIARRRTPDGSYLVGFLDLREYEYGLRPAALHPLRPAPTSMLAADKFALSENESLGYAVVSAAEVRQRLLSDATVYGLWRKVGETRWRGEFQGSSERDLDRWLPERGYTK